jgi:hypothetical protein
MKIVDLKESYELGSKNIEEDIVSQQSSLESSAKTSPLPSITLDYYYCLNSDKPGISKLNKLENDGLKSNKDNYCIEDLSDSILKSVERLNMHRTESKQSSKLIADALKCKWNSIYHNEIDKNFKFINENVSKSNKFVNKKQIRLPNINDRNNNNNNNYSYGYGATINYNYNANFNTYNYGYGNVANTVIDPFDVANVINFRKAEKAKPQAGLIGKKKPKKPKISNKEIKFPACRVTLRTEDEVEEEIEGEDENYEVKTTLTSIKLAKEDILRLNLNESNTNLARQLYFHPKSLSFSPNNVSSRDN